MHIEQFKSSFREIAVNTHTFSRSLAVATVLLSAPALAEQFGPLEVIGFVKNEYSLCDNCSSGLVNKSEYDPRGVLLPPDPMVKVTLRRLRVPLSWIGKSASISPL